MTVIRPYTNDYSFDGPVRKHGFKYSFVRLACIDGVIDTIENIPLACSQHVFYYFT